MRPPNYSNESQALLRRVRPRARGRSGYGPRRRKHRRLCQQVTQVFPSTRISPLNRRPSRWRPTEQVRHNCRCLEERCSTVGEPQHPVRRLIQSSSEVSPLCRAGAAVKAVSSSSHVNGHLILAPVTDSHGLAIGANETDYIAQMSAADAGGMWPPRASYGRGRVVAAKAARA